MSKEIVLAYALEFVFIIILKNISAIILIYVLSYSSLVGLIIGCLLAVAIIVVIVMRFLFPDCKYTYLQIQYCDTLFPIYTTLHHTPLSYTQTTANKFLFKLNVSLKDYAQYWETGDEQRLALYLLFKKSFTEDLTMHFKS